MRDLALASMATLAAASAVLLNCFSAPTNDAAFAPPTRFVNGADPPRITLCSTGVKLKSGLRPVDVWADWAGPSDYDLTIDDASGGEEGRQNDSNASILAEMGYLDCPTAHVAESNFPALPSVTEGPKLGDFYNVSFDIKNGLNDPEHVDPIMILILAISACYGWVVCPLLYNMITVVYPLLYKMITYGLHVCSRKSTRHPCPCCAPWPKKVKEPKWRPEPWSRDDLSGDYDDLSSSSSDEDTEPPLKEAVDDRVGRCEHGVMEERGPCDDVTCSHGKIFDCIHCGYWCCKNGTCGGGGVGREGHGSPPTLTTQAVDQVGRLSRMVVRIVWRLPWAIAMRLMVMMSFPEVAEAVTCRTCFDQCEGCAGGAACPLLTVTANNGRLLVGAAMAAGAAGAAAATALSARDVFPLRFNKVLHRGILDRLLVLGRRPPPGTPVDVTGLTNVELADPVMTAGVELDSLLQEISSRALAAGNQLEVAKLNALTTSLTTRHKIGAGARGAVELTEGTTALVGAYLYCVVLAMRIVRSKHTDVSLVMDESKAAGTSDSAMPPAKLSRPTSMAEFASMLNVWTMLLSGLGMASVLITNTFLNDVVFDQTLHMGLPWEVAFELFIVYLEEVERTAGDDVNLGNVYGRGAQDTMLQRARERAPKQPRGRDIKSFRGLDDDEPVKWNGSWNRKATTTCHTYNLKNKFHPASSLNEKGGCKHNHICDHWVSDKGRNGICGGDHPRLDCTNPAKCDSPVQ